MSNADLLARTGVWIFPLRRASDNAKTLVNLFRVNTVLIHEGKEAYIGLEGFPAPLVVKTGPDLAGFYDSLAGRRDVHELTRATGEVMLVKSGAIIAAVENNEYEALLVIADIPKEVPILTDERWKTLCEALLKFQSIDGGNAPADWDLDELPF